ncbi:short chain dehydrogenase/reductase [Phyllosticta citriasiana]|uniref:short chain dehydrogenase/reductase n=1 Tax=Phyllosticta citriasiana TaxID=595635 RepID=UPI0030FD9D82
MPASAVFAPCNTALITGGASGIGLALAKRCAAQGMKLAVVDIDPDTLARAKAELSKDGAADVETYAVNVASHEEWDKLKKDAVGRFGSVEVLALNAGTAGKGSRWGEREGFEKILGTNLWGVVNGVNAFVPVLQQQKKQAAIIVTGSKQGITNPPGNPAYNASKAAVKTLAEHLDYDLRDEKHLSVHLLVPGWTFTGMTGGGPSASREKPAGAWSADQVVSYLVQKMEKDKFYVICPDNDVDEATDKKRILWSIGDVVEERPALTRWRDEWKGEAREWMERTSV